MSLDDWEIDEQHLSDSGRLAARAMPVTLLGSTFSRREALSAVARAFDVTPEEAVELTADLLERERRGPGAGRPRSTPNSSGPRAGISSRPPVATAATRPPNCWPLSSGSSAQRWPAWTRPRASGTPPVDEVLRRHRHLDGEQAEGVRSCSPRATATTWSSARPARGSPPCSPPPGSAGSRPGSGSSAPRWPPGRPPTSKPVPASRARRSPTSLADLREAGGLTSRHVIVVDEASMVGSRTLDQLCRHADAAGAKVVLVGDNRQLSSIDAGGALRTLSQDWALT